MSIPYKTVYSKRRSIAIHINGDRTVTVRAPYRTPPNSIEKLVKSREKWINEHIRKQSRKIKIATSGEYSEGSILLFNGKKHTLSIKESSTDYIRISEDIFEVGSRKTDSRRITLLIDKWYKQQALIQYKSLLGMMLERHAEQDFKPTAITVRSMKSRWGSCNRSGKITLNTHLVKIDPVYSEYVMLHELCHLREMNHGERFYAILREICPDYKTMRIGLREHTLV